MWIPTGPAAFFLSRGRHFSEEEDMKNIDKNGYGKGTFIESDMFLSNAFITLGKRKSVPVTSWASQAILMMFLGKRSMRKRSDKKGSNKQFRAMNNDELTLTYKELESRGINQKSATRGIDELLAKGFITIVDQGGCYEKHKAVYGLSDKYNIWRPGTVFETRNRDVLRGYQKPKEKSSQTLKGDTHTDVKAGVPNQTGTQTLKGGTPTKKKAKVNDETIC
jgi:hypothetical protein